MEKARLRQFLKAAARLGIVRRSDVREALHSENPLEWLKQKGVLDDEGESVVREPRVRVELGKEVAMRARRRIAFNLACRQGCVKNWRGRHDIEALVEAGVLSKERAKEFVSEAERRYGFCEVCGRVYPRRKIPEAGRCSYCGAALVGAVPMKGDATVVHRGPRRIGQYLILGELGRGAMGVVYKGLQESLGRHVAIKVMTHATILADEGAVKRFVREARVMAQLSHPNIATIYDVGEQDGQHYIVMEYIDGSTCEEILRRRGRFTEFEALEIAIPVAEALNHLYRNNLVHRDVKPSNIMVDRRSGVVKLCDLGLARSADAASLTQEGTVVGTPYYISPEQAEGRTDIDIRADIYSLGATLYHLVTGRVPFDDATAMRILIKHLSEPLVPPQQVLPTISEAFSKVITRMMMKDRDKRYRNPEEVLVDLRRLQEGRPPLYAEQSPRDRLVRKYSGFFDQLRTYFFARGLVGLLLGLASSDGSVDPEELESFRKFFKEGLKGSDSGIVLLEHLMREAIRQERDIESLCDECRQFSGYQERLMLLDLLYRVAMADRKLKPEEEKFIERVVDLLEISESDHLAIRAQYVPDEDEKHHLQALGLSGQFGPDDVKAAYKRLLLKYDPANFAQLGEEFVEMAKRRLNAIKDAYNYFRRKMGF